MTSAITLLSLLSSVVVGLASESSRGERRAERPGARLTFCDPATGCANRSIFYANTSSALFTIDLAGGSPRVTHVGDFGAEITDVAGTPDGRLFAASFRMLYSVDPSTGRATPIGPFGVSNVNGLAASGSRLLASSTDGFLYSVDPTTGRATVVGGFGQGLRSSGDLCFGPGGALYMTAPQGSGPSAPDRLVRIDASTGAAATIGGTGHGRIYGLAWAAGWLVGVTESGAVLRIDPGTAASTVIGQAGAPFWGAF